MDRPTDHGGARAASVESWIQRTPYRERYKFIPLIQISPNLQRVVIAEKDARFYEHLGFDWHQIQIAAEEDLEGKRTRGASTITQQLVKNLFFGTGRSVLRKGAEFTLVPVAEAILGKQRILELYLNVVEWALVFMARMRPAITTTGLRPAISIRNRLHGSQLFCLLP